MGGGFGSAVKIKTKDMTDADKTAWKDQIMAHCAVWEKCPPEAMAKVEAIPEEQHMKWLDEHFKAADKNADGVLDKEEMRVYMAMDQDRMTAETGFDQGGKEADFDSFFEVLTKHAGTTSVSKDLLMRYHDAFDAVTTGK